MILKRYSARLLCFSLLVCFFYGRSALALSVQPSAADVVVTDTFSLPETRVVTVLNNSDVFHEYRVEVRSVRFDEQGEIEDFDEIPPAISDWVEITPKTFSLEPGKQQSISVVFSPTLDSSWRHLVLGVVVFEQQTMVSSGALVGGAASLFFITLGENLHLETQFSDLTTSPYESGASTLVTATIKNTGDLPAIPSGVLVVKNMWGKTVARTAFNQAQKRIPFATTRSLSEVWHHGDPASISFFSRALSQIRHFYFGKYTISLSLAAVDSSSAPAVRSTEMWLWPRELLFLASGVFAIFFVFIIFFVQKRNKGKGGA